MSKNRIGIVTVDMFLLERWMHIPIGTRVVDVRRRDNSIFGQFEVLVEGDAIPETDFLEATPHLSCTVTVTEPKVEFVITSPRPPIGHGAPSEEARYDER